MALDPNDSGYILDSSTFRRLVDAIRKIESLPLNKDGFEEIPNRRIYEKPRAVRGQSTTTQSGAVVLMKNFTPLAAGMPPPVLNSSGQLRVANIYFPRSLVTDQWFDAIYSPNVISGDDVRADGVQVDWETFEAGTGVSSSLRRFELAQDKLTTQSPAVVNWLTDSETIVPGTDIVYDPEHQFSGVVSGYVGTGPGFRGAAVLRTDMGTAVGTGLGGNRWEMIDLQGYARYILSNYQNTGTGTGTAVSDAYIYQGIYPTDDGWQTRQPYPPNSFVYTPSITTGSALVKPIEGDNVLMLLYSADGLGPGQPLYIPVCVTDRTAIVQAFGTGGEASGFSLPLANNLFPGRYGNVCNAPPVDTDMTGTCKIVDLMSRTKLANKSFHIGRFVGLSGTGTNQYPIYAIDTSLRMVSGITTALVSSVSPTFTINTLTSIVGATPPSPLIVSQVFPVGYANGAGVIAIERTDGTWINTPAVAGTGADRLVAAGTDDLAPATLIEKVYPTGIFDATKDILVTFQEVTNVGVQKILAYIPTGTGTGTGSGTATPPTYVTINSVTGIGLSLSSAQLSVTLSYERYRVLGLDLGTGGQFTGAVGAGTCGT